MNQMYPELKNTNMTRDQQIDYMINNPKPIPNVTKEDFDVFMKTLEKKLKAKHRKIMRGEYND